jgi:hypothetical protein
MSGGSITGATLIPFVVSAGTASATYGGGITQAANNPMVSVSGGHNTGTITFQTGSLSATSGNGLQFDNADGTYNFDGTTTLNGGDAGVDILNGSSGTFSFASGMAITNPSGTAFNISGGGAANVTYAGTITHDVGAIVSIAGETGTSTKAFTGAITDGDDGDGSGISLTGNSATTTMRFAGGLVLNTGANAAFTATGGGTVEICDENPCNPGAVGALINKITTTSATALNVANTTIGANNLEFRSISSIGGSSTGIILDTTGPSGGLTVTGDGTNTSVGGNSTGGTIAGKSGLNGSTTTGIGVYLNNTRNVVLRRMTINGTNQNYGIRGNLVTNFTLEYSTVSGANGTVDSLPSPENYGEGAIHFGNATTNGVLGTVTFTNNSISGGRARNLSIVNTATGTTTLTIKGNTFGAIQAGAGNQSLAVEARVSSGIVINSTVGGTAAGEPNTFTSAPADLVNFTGQDQTTMDVVFRNNVLSNNHAGNIIGGCSLTLATKGTMTFNVDGNSFRDAHGSAITLFKASATIGTPSFSGIFNNNTIGVSGVADSGSKSGNGIFVSAGGTGTMSFTITNNTIRRIAGNGHIYADNTGGSYTANFTIKGNLFDEPGATEAFAIGMTNGSPSSGDTVDVCAAIGGSIAAEKNTINFSPVLGIVVGSSGANGGHSFRLPGLPTSTEAGVESFLTTNNTGSFTVDAYADAPATFAAFTGTGTTCPTP